MTDSASEWLNGPYAKLDRAVEHCEALECACDEFIKTNPYYVKFKFEPEFGHYVGRFRIRENPPFRLSMIFGDVLHNLRDALDHATWVAACQTNDVVHLWKPSIAKKIQFPVVSDPDDFPNQKVIPFLSSAAVAVCKALQPYNTGDVARDIGRVNAYNNIEKHRVVHASGGHFDFSRVVIRPKSMDWDILQGGITDELVHNFGNGIEDGTHIFSVWFNAGPPSDPDTTHVDVTGQPSSQIIFGAGGEAKTLNVLIEMCFSVKVALDSFKPLFS